MTDYMYVDVPEDLWAALDEEGFEEAEDFRGVDDVIAVTQGVLSFADQGLGLGVNLVTVILAKEAIGSFVAGVRDRALRRRPAASATASAPASAPASEVEVRLSVSRGGTATDVVVTARGTGDGGIDTSALERVLTEAIDGTLRDGPGA